MLRFKQLLLLAYGYNIVDLNTSHVEVQADKVLVIACMMDNLNTSHVEVQVLKKVLNGISNIYLNTPHVEVQENRVTL